MWRPGLVLPKRAVVTKPTKDFPVVGIGASAGGSGGVHKTAATPPRRHRNGVRADPASRSQTREHPSATALPRDQHARARGHSEDEGPAESRVREFGQLRRDFGRLLVFRVARRMDARIGNTCPSINSSYRWRNRRRIARSESSFREPPRTGRPGWRKSRPRAASPSRRIRIRPSSTACRAARSRRVLWILFFARRK